MPTEQNGNRISLTDNLVALKTIQRSQESKGGSQLKGDQVRTRQTFQQGYVSDPIRRRNGVVFVIRYRIRTASGKWQHRSETLHGLSGKKAARGVLEQRLREASNCNPETNELTVHEFVDACWRPYLDRKAAKPSTRKGYESGLKLHVFPKLGDIKLVDVAPMHIEELLKTRLEAGLSPKSVRNLVALLQSMSGTIGAAGHIIKIKDALDTERDVPPGFEEGEISPWVIDLWEFNNATFGKLHQKTGVGGVMMD